MESRAEDGRSAGHWLAYDVLEVTVLHLQAVGVEVGGLELRGLRAAPLHVLVPVLSCSALCLSRTANSAIPIMVSLRL